MLEAEVVAELSVGTTVEATDASVDNVTKKKKKKAKSARSTTDAEIEVEEEVSAFFYQYSLPFILCTLFLVPVLDLL